MALVSKRIATAALVAFLAWIPSIARAEQKPFEQIVPEDTTLFCSLKSVSGVSKWFESSPLGEAWRSREMEEFTKKMTVILEKAVTEAEKEMPGLLTDMKAVCRGEMAIAVGGLGKMLQGSKDIPLAFLVDVGADKAKARQLHDRLVEQAMKEGKVKKREADFRGQKILTLEPEAKEGEDQQDSPPLSMCLADDLMLMGTSREYIERILVTRGDAAEKSLAANAQYKDLREKYGKDSAFFAYANVGWFVENAAALAKLSEDTSPDDLKMVKPILDLLGFGSMRAIVVSATLGSDSVDSTMYCLAPGGAKGAMRALWTKPTALRFPPTIPDDVSSATVMQVDFDALYQSIVELVRVATAAQAGGEGGPGGEMGDPIKMIEQQLGLNFQQDLVAPLGKQVITYDRIKKPFDATSGSQGTFLIELKDKDRFQATLDKLLAMVPFFKKGEYLGRPLYSFGMGGPEEGGDDSAEESPVPMPALGVTSTHFVFGMSKGLVEEAIRRVGKEVKSINDAPGYQEVARLLPSSSIMIGYQSADAIEYLFYTMKQLGGLMGAGSMDFEDFGEEPSDEDSDDPGAGSQRSKEAKSGDFDMQKAFTEAMEALPDASVFTKHMAGTITFGFSEDRGVGVTSRMLFKKK